MSRLGDILNTHPEVAGQKTRLPRLQGSIEFDQVLPLPPRRRRRAAPGVAEGASGRGDRHRRALRLGKSTLTWLVQCSMCLTAAGCWSTARSGDHRHAQPAPADRRGAAGEHAVQPPRCAINIALAHPAAPIELVMQAGEAWPARRVHLRAAEDIVDTVVGEHALACRRRASASLTRVRRSPIRASRSSTRPPARLTTRARRSFTTTCAWICQAAPC